MPLAFCALVFPKGRLRVLFDRIDEEFGISRVSQLTGCCNRLKESPWGDFKLYLYTGIRLQTFTLVYFFIQGFRIIT